MKPQLCQAQTKDCTGRAVHMHHRKRRSQGGTNDPTNLIAVCVACHSYIHNHPAISYERGWLVHSWDAA